MLILPLPVVLGIFLGYWNMLLSNKPHSDLFRAAHKLHLHEGGRRGGSPGRKLVQIGEGVFRTCKGLYFNREGDKLSSSPSAIRSHLYQDHRRPRFQIESILFCLLHVEDQKVLILPMLVVLGTFLGHWKILLSNKPHIWVFETVTFWSFLKDPNFEKNVTLGWSEINF